ncbi:DNA polymerase I [Cocleimonas sp. KMM 6892]|uniref:DNA polymerase I n=1 Tax=unclassified Cocleimonas TaxID=2639732 RepID=UPI002DC01272|nr:MULTISPECIES: DNA polymerase I [unclassified Cocleimonas]MEB8431492.1 DNA polymerase I [Cocleimonas sp. KMM 6892]MEC4713736.1 DNA polymerase I [Cocleimonas sp. KMM 6895]MEC4743067.1 DNA polymerase I [Cocleimonas sp. KMM 6896]
MSDKNTSKPLVLVDGSSYLFRAFYALPSSLTSPDGMQTNAIHGVLNMLDRLRKDYQPDHMAVIFDAKGKTFRNDMFPEYKATRPPMPDELRDQIEPLHKIIEAQGYPMIVMPGVEADDVIGTMSKLYDGDVIISTGDKDMAQLVDDQISLINTMSNSFHDRAGVIEKYGVPPERIRDYLALMGDKVDNIPGVPKVGPKTAVKWLTEYDSLDAIMQNADKFGGKIGENLRESLEFLPLSYELVTIKCDLELDVSPEYLSFNKENKQLLAELYQKYGFRTRLSNLQSTSDTPIQLKPEAVGSNSDSEEIGIPEIEEIKEVDYQTILTEEQLDSWIADLKDSKLFAFDTETTSLAYMDARVVGMSFCIKAGTAAYLPLAHDYVGVPQQLNFNETLAKLKPLLEDPTILKVGQNLKYDRSVLLNHDIELKGIAHDTMLESYVLDSVSNRHDMDTLCEKHLGHINVKFEDVAGKGKKQLTFNQIQIDDVVQESDDPDVEATVTRGAAYYAAEDADMTLRLHNFFWPQLKPRQSQEKLYREIEVPLLKVLSDIERNGVLVNAEMLAKQSEELTVRMKELEQDIYESAGGEFNLGSPKQIQEIFFNEDKLNLPVIRKTPKGQPSTAEDVLQELAEEHDVPRWLLEHRGLSKLKSTYTEKLPLEINPQTGRVHTSYHQAVAATGRLSSSNPNLQNIPVRNAEGRRIRQSFVAPEGFKILAADYSQIELRIMAHLSGDDGLVEAFSQGKDIHRATAAEIFEVGLDDVQTEQRRAAKAVNFGLIYGMSAFGLAKQLKVSRTEAAEYVTKYFKRYPGVKHYMEDTREKAKEDGYVETLFGRRLYLPEINAKNAMRRQYAERTAINAPMQGTAADIIKVAMIGVNDWLREGTSNTTMIMQVHDELVFEVAEDEIEAVQSKIIERMVNAAKLDVPLVVDTGLGINWDEAH